MYIQIMRSEIVDQLFRHSAWANQKLLKQLSELPDKALTYSGWNPDWTVGKLASHIVSAQGRMLVRATGVEIEDERGISLTSEGMKHLAAVARGYDEKFYKILDLQDTVMDFKRLGNEVHYRCSTIAAQVVHHSTEHRTQISDILAMNNLNVINLDTFDHWTHEVEARS
jgi:uncharacterized damage-inducible protein DinB